MSRPRPDLALLAFALSFAVFQHVPSLVGGRAADYLDLVTPFAVVATTAVALASLGAPPAAVVLGLAAAVLYVDGHGIHLAANSIAHEPLSGDAEDVAHFWDESFGHIWWHLGWVGLVAAVAVAEARSGRPRGRRPRSWPVTALTVAALGGTLFTSTVEGGTWWLGIAAAVLLVAWAATRPRPLLVTAAAAFALDALLVAGWAIWQGGVPQFSEVGWL